jgi:putative ABC transport system substrate-binding protein
VRRRAIIAAIAAVACGSAERAFGQAPGRTFRLGHLAPNEPTDLRTREILLPELARHGFVAGRNLVVESRFGGEAAFPELARALLAARPDAVVATGGAAARAMREATSSVPIVIFADDPVELGYAASLARPGGNVTGVALMVVSLQAKRLELLLEAVPAARRVGALLRASSPQRPAGERALRVSAAAAGVELLVVEADVATDYPAAFAALRARGADALLIGADPLFADDVARLAALALDARLPTICEWASNARDGCVLGYGPDRVALRRRMADQIARIFRGAAAGDVPIEQPTLFEFAINLRTARALGVAIPAPLIARADEVIE